MAALNICPAKLENKPTNIITGPITAVKVSAVIRNLLTGPKALNTLSILSKAFPIVVIAVKNCLPIGIRSACKVAFILKKLAAGDPLAAISISCFATAAISPVDFPYNSKTFSV